MRIIIYIFNHQQIYIYIPAAWGIYIPALTVHLPLAIYTSRGGGVDTPSRHLPPGGITLMCKGGVHNFLGLFCGRVNLRCFIWSILCLNAYFIQYMYVMFNHFLFYF